MAQPARLTSPHSQQRRPRSSPLLWLILLYFIKQGTRAARGLSPGLCSGPSRGCSEGTGMRVANAYCKALKTIEKGATARLPSARASFLPLRCIAGRFTSSRRQLCFSFPVLKTILTHNQRSYACERVSGKEGGRTVLPLCWHARAVGVRHPVPPPREDINHITVQRNVSVRAALRAGPGLLRRVILPHPLFRGVVWCTLPSTGCVTCIFIE